MEEEKVLKKNGNVSSLLNGFKSGLQAVSTYNLILH